MMSNEYTIMPHGSATSVLSSDGNNFLHPVWPNDNRYIRLTNLIPELLKMVDEKRIAFNPAVELSYLPKEAQKTLLEAMEVQQCTPSLSQAQRMKTLHQQGKLGLDMIFKYWVKQKPISGKKSASAMKS